MRLTGGVVIDAETSGDFCLLSRFQDEDCARFDVRANDLIAYHYVRSGRLYASVDGEPPIAAKAGDIILLPRNDVHLLYSRPGLQPVDSHDLIQVAPDGPARIVINHGGDAAGLYCGFLGVSAEHHPLLDSLPPILKLDGSDDAHGEWIETSMRMLNEAGNSPELIARLSELFFAEAIRRYMDRLLPGEGGWLGGLKDPAVAKALSVIHSRFAEDLDIETLAREAGVSRTVLGERFAHLLGEPPMRYCARWRMRVAANMLRDGKQNASNVAYAVGFNSEAAFNRAFKREYGEPPATWRRKVEEQARSKNGSAGLPEQVVRYCTAHDGTKLAFSVVGEGPPLVKAANWLNHIEHDWKSPVWRHWLKELTRNHTLIRYDERANGMSDWDTPEISFEAFVDDLECVVDCAGVEKFDLLGISQGASVAIAYAVRHPAKVRRLLIIGGYAQGWKSRNVPEEVARREALLTLTEVGWGADHPTYRQVFTSLYIPDGTAEQISWWNDMQKVSCSPQNAVKLQRALSEIDVRDLLSQVSVPTLIFHSKEDQVVPFAAGEYLARNIPGSTFVPLEGENHILLKKEPAWAAFTRLSRQFLKPEENASDPPVLPRPKRTPRIQRPAVQHCTAVDGTDLAYAVSGEGPPLIKVPNWFSHLEEDWDSPVWTEWFEWLSSERQLLRYDGRGHGASGRVPAHISPAGFVEDLAAVADSAEWERFDLLGIGHGATVALSFAQKHPERVQKLVLLGPWAVGWRRREDLQDIARREAIVELSRIGWELETPLYRELYTKLYAPGANAVQVDWLNQVQRTAANAKHAVDFQRAMGDIDIRDELSSIRTPTLIMHAVHDRAVPLSCGEDVAQRMGVDLVRLESENHVPLPQEREWPRIKWLVDDFLSRRT